MLTRRNVTLSLAALPLGGLGGAYASTQRPEAEGGKHSVLMLNADCNDSNDINVFEPRILRIAVGDSVTFLATDSGHNAASKRGMIPEGAEGWNGGIDEELTVEFTIPGIYGYLCLPHYEVGMVGLIVVGDDLSNLADVKKVRHPGDARGNFRALLAELETEGGSG